MLPLDGIKLKDLEAGFMSRQHKFALFYPDGKCVFSGFLIFTPFIPLIVRALSLRDIF